MKLWKKTQTGNDLSDKGALPEEGLPSTAVIEDIEHESSELDMAQSPSLLPGEREDSEREQEDQSNDEPEEEAAAREYEFRRIKGEVHQQVVGRIDLTALGGMEENELRIEVHRACEQVLDERSDLLNKEDRERIFREVIDETFGLGPLEPILADDSISEIMINGPDTIYVEKNGRLQLSKVTFASEAHLLKIVQKVVADCNCSNGNFYNR